jgi:hypothetical protein
VRWWPWGGFDSGGMVAGNDTARETRVPTVSSHGVCGVGEVRGEGGCQVVLELLVFSVCWN